MVQILPAPTPDPYAGQNTQAFVKILQTLGQYEGVRQKGIRESNVLEAIARGGEPQQILMSIASAMQEPISYDTGLRGFFQRIATPFAPQADTGITDMMVKGAISQAFTQRSKIQELINEGYSPEEARLIRDISHGIKPRASVRQTYDNMTDVEKLNWLTTLKQRAEGQYYGVEGGNVQPREPKVLDWVNSELEKLEIYKSQRGSLAETGQASEVPGDLGVGFGLPLQAKKVAVKEQQAHRIIYDAWDHFPRKLQDAIRMKEQAGESYEDILQYDEVKEILKKVVK